MVPSLPILHHPARLAGVLCACLLACAGARAQGPLPSADARTVDYDQRAIAGLAPDAYGAGRAASGLPYRLLTPVGPKPAAGFPLVLLLHGSGAIGTDNLAQLDTLAMSWALPAVRAGFPAYVVAPQFARRSASYARGQDGIRASHAAPALRDALALVDEFAARYPVDRHRIYVVGFSMGASSAWQAALARPDLFAAAVPIAGIAPARSEAKRLRGMPLLIAHGDADDVNPIGADAAMLKALHEAGNADAELVVYPRLMHAVAPNILFGRWWRAWLFARKRQDAATDQ